MKKIIIITGGRYGRGRKSYGKGGYRRGKRY